MYTDSTPELPGLEYSSMCYTEWLNWILGNDRGVGIKPENYLWDQLYAESHMDVELSVRCFARCILSNS